MKAIEPITAANRHGDEFVASPIMRALAAQPIMRRAAESARPATTSAPMSDGLRSAIRALARQLGGALTSAAGNVAGVFGEAVNAGVHDFGATNSALRPVGGVRDPQAPLPPVGGAYASIGGSSIAGEPRNPRGAFEDMTTPTGGTLSERLGSRAGCLAGVVEPLQATLPQELRAELAQLATTPTGRAAIAAEVTSATNRGGESNGTAPLPSDIVARSLDRA